MVNNIYQDGELVALREIKYIKMLTTCQNVVGLHVTFKGEDCYYLVTEYAKHGSFIEYVMQN